MKSRELPPLQPLLLTADETAKLLGVCRTTLYEMNVRGRMPAPLKICRRPRWRVAEIEAWIAAGCPSRREWNLLSATRESA